MNLRSVMLRGIGLLAGLAMFSGCVGSKASLTWKTPPKDRARLAQFRKVCIDVRAQEGVTLLQDVRIRMGRKINEYIRTGYAGKYKPVASGNAGPETLAAHVLITRYDDGIAFAQYVFAGQSRMRIDGEVTLSDWQTQEKLAEFNVSTTVDRDTMFSSLGMDDLEPDFAAGVVAGITLQE